MTDGMSETNLSFGLKFRTRKAMAGCPLLNRKGGKVPGTP
jgi:hypothetical protein